MSVYRVFWFSVTAGISLLFASVSNSPRVSPCSPPQAKGRVERNHGVYQDRFVKELRLSGISTIAEGNRYREETYLERIHGKFARPAADSADAHVPMGKTDLREIMGYVTLKALALPVIPLDRGGLEI